MAAERRIVVMNGNGNREQLIARNLGHLEPAHISGNLTEKNCGRRLQGKAFDRKLQRFECNIVCCFV